MSELLPDAVIWDAPDGEAPARRASQRSYAAVARKAAFWDVAIEPVAEFRFTIRDSFANGNACANIGTFSTRLLDGSLADTDLIAVYRVDEAGLITSMAAHWEVERTMATVRPG